MLQRNIIARKELNQLTVRHSIDRSRNIGCRDGGGPAPSDLTGPPTHLGSEDVGEIRPSASSTISKAIWMHVKISPPREARFNHMATLPLVPVIHLDGGKDHHLNRNLALR